MKVLLSRLVLLGVLAVAIPVSANDGLFCSEWGGQLLGSRSQLKVITARVVRLHIEKQSGMFLWNGKKWEHAESPTPEEVFLKTLSAYSDSQDVQMAQGSNGEGVWLVRWTRCLDGTGQMTYLFEYTQK